MNAKRRIVFKTLNERGESPQVGMKWPLPRGARPGAWVEIEGDPVICRRGLHGWMTYAIAERQGAAAIYEMEVEGRIVEGSDKLAATRARLLRKVQFEGKVLEYGSALCEECGRAHNCYSRPGGMRSWADPTDGHAYRREAPDKTIERMHEAMDAALECLRVGVKKTARPDTAREVLLKARSLTGRRVPA